MRTGSQKEQPCGRDPMPDTDTFDADATASPSLRTLAARGEIRRYRKGTVLIEEGDRGDNLFIILKGQVRAFASSSDDDREVTFGYYGPGEYMGEMSLDGGHRSASVMVVEPTTCSVVTRAMIEQHIAQDPHFAFELLSKVIRRARMLTARTKDLSLNSVYGRLAKLLSALAIPEPDGTRIVSEHSTHQELANRLGCSRAMVTRLLKDLATNGSVMQDGRHLRILKELPPKW
jgi:CRP/FNR family transcriptional regulator, cyclic AMP receptor protein